MELRKIPEIFSRYAALFLSRIRYLRQVAGALGLAYPRRLLVRIKDTLGAVQVLISFHTCKFKAGSAARLRDARPSGPASTSVTDAMLFLDSR
jgi:hypothetical protein